eukprot:TRINITY_DN6402_c0_g1_i3.p1 TRINITY_DN6402_c0_g1~~TRINITY_DN6402_c0_g1_i3.p1  ORF type:complete len:319 (-),score=25.00 TRINITY_DN6402_c0_g1_i3:51-1007(-)
MTRPEMYNAILEFWEGVRLEDVPPSQAMMVDVDASHVRSVLRGEEVYWNDTTGFPLGTSELPDVDYSELPFSSMGRLVGHDGYYDQNFACTASVINPGVLLTAGHCCGENGKFYENLLFQPHYKGGCYDPENKTQPCASNVTLLPVTHLYALSGWIDDAEWADDYCFAEVAIPDGMGGLISPPSLPSPEAVAEKFTAAGIGLLGLTVNCEQFGVVFTACGYPAEAPFPGNKIFCTTNSGTYGGSGTFSIPSKLNEGASGGPWVIGATITDGKVAESNQNHVNGLNSHVFSYTPEMYSPIFVNATWQVYESAVGNMTGR